MHRIPCFSAFMTALAAVVPQRLPFALPLRFALVAGALFLAPLSVSGQGTLADYQRSAALDGRFDGLAPMYDLSLRD